MMPARTAAGRFFDIVSGLCAIAIFTGIVFGLVGAVAITVMRWLTGWPA